MLKLIAILGVFFNCLSILAAEATTADAGPVVSTVTWDKEFRPIYPEVGHDSWTEAYNSPGLYDWLLPQKRAK